MGDSSPPVTVRLATADDELAVRRILDGAMLEFADLAPRIDADHVLVASDARFEPSENCEHANGEAVSGHGPREDNASDLGIANGEAVSEAERDDEPIHGAIVLEPEPTATVTEGLAWSDEGQSRSVAESGAHVDAIAVRKRRRGRGIGTTLVERALSREGRLTAHFDERVRPFYEALSFEIVSLGDGRFAGIRRR